MYHRICAPSEDSDQPAHSRSLNRIFTGGIFDGLGCKDSSCGQRRLINMSEGTFLTLPIVYIYLCVCLCVCGK